MSFDEDSIFDRPGDDEFERLQRRKKNLPIYKKAMEISETVHVLVSTLKGRDKKIFARNLIESSLLLPAKIAGAAVSDNWLTSIQNAAIVRDHAQYLLTASNGLKHMTQADEDYIKVLRTEMEEFRELFKEWAAEIHKMEKDDSEDEWGLFVR